MRLFLSLFIFLFLIRADAAPLLKDPIVTGAPDFSGISNASTVRSQFGLAIGTNVQAYDADLTTYAGITPSANVQTLLGAANYSTFRSSLGLGSAALLAASAGGNYDADAGKVVTFDFTGGFTAFSISLGGSPIEDSYLRIFSANLASNVTIRGAAGWTGSRTVTTPNADTKLLISSYHHNITGPSAARTITVPDSNWSAARTDAGQTFTGTQTFSTPIAIASGGTGFTGYGTRARVVSPNTASHIAVATATATKLSFFTSETEDATAYWNAASSQTTTLPAGGYFYSIVLATDETGWRLRLYDDGVASYFLGATYLDANWSGVFVADGASVYSFYVSQASGSSKNVYDDPSYQGLTLIRLW